MPQDLLNFMKIRNNSLCLRKSMRTTVELFRTHTVLPSFVNSVFVPCCYWLHVSGSMNVRIGELSGTATVLCAAGAFLYPAKFSTSDTPS